MQKNISRFQQYCSKTKLRLATCIAIDIVPEQTVIISQVNSGCLISYKQLYHSVSGVMHSGEEICL